MKITILISCFIGFTLAKPSSPLFEQIIPLVGDTAEVIQAKSEHAAAHYNEHFNALPDSNVVGYTLAKLQPGAPISSFDGKVLDTPEVVYAKAEHAAAHANERLNHAILKSPYYPIYSPYYIASPTIHYI